tara:strand:- start:182 stop:331 length:150 start_codon:yes stop_codon:yes gene_type:complete
LTVIKKGGEGVLIGAGLQHENILVEIQRYDFEVTWGNSISFSHLMQFSN